MPKASFTVGPFQSEVDDSDEIADMHLKIRKWEQKVGQADFSGRLRGSQDDLRTLDQYYIAGGGNFFIAKDAKGDIIGFVGLRNDGKGHGTFKRLAVVPGWQRKGVGRALVGASMDWARQAGFNRLGLQTHSKEHARPLYEEFGFKVTGWVEDRQDWLMERAL